ncbi:MAG: VPDSG-CTERM-specific exosortase XrtC [Verrucomicrobiia bacterium]|jgi:exosortase C (VPDSG-CTERM-specific)
MNTDFNLDSNIRVIPSLHARPGVGQNPAAVDRSGWPKGFMWATILLVACFSVPLFHLARFAATSELYSHILLVPFVSVYLAWSNRRNMRGFSGPNRRFVVFAWCAGLVVLAGYWLVVWSGWPMTTQDGLAWTTAAFVCFFFGVCGLFVSREALQAMRFPLCFLVFMVPFPTVVHNWLESLLQRGSALTAYGLFQLAGTPVFYNDPNFQLPGFALQVAPECSGIHSSLVLFLTSLVAGHLFLRSPWKQGILALAVLPLGLLRNGFRIFVIGQLCIHIGPQMVHSPIHHDGGPIFFALSMVPFFLLLILLRRSEPVPAGPTDLQRSSANGRN